MCLPGGRFTLLAWDIVLCGPGLLRGQHLPDLPSATTQLWLVQQLGVYPCSPRLVLVMQAPAEVGWLPTTLLPRSL
jgi:hypothetical protein